MPRNYDRKHAAEQAEWDPTVTVYGGKYAADDGFRDDYDETRRSKTAREIWSHEKASRHQKKQTDYESYLEIARLKSDGRNVLELVNPDDYIVEKDELGHPTALRTWNNTLFLAPPGLRPKSRGPNARTRRHASRAQARADEGLEDGKLEPAAYHSEVMRIKGTLGKPPRPVPRTPKVPGFGQPQKPVAVRKKIEEKNKVQSQRKQKMPERRSATKIRTTEKVRSAQKTPAKPWAAKQGAVYHEKTKKVTHKADMVHAERVSKKILDPPE